MEDDKTIKTGSEVFGAAASEQLGLAYQLIPPEALRRLGRIFLEGQVKYPGKAVNALNMASAVGNRPWQVERFNHAVDHLLRWGQGDTMEDHLAKVMWFCSVMIEVARREKLETSCSETTCDSSSFCRSLITGIIDPVHRHHDGAWYFVDETEAHCNGPYTSRQEAAEACTKYGASL